MSAALSTRPPPPLPTVLVVDDEADIRAALALALTAEGYPVAAVADGASALAYLRDHAPPALILLDLTMPGMDGWQVLTALRAAPAWSAIPVVVCTATPRHHARIAALGATPVLYKPFALDLLLAVVEGRVRARRGP